MLNQINRKTLILLLGFLLLLAGLLRVSGVEGADSEPELISTEQTVEQDLFLTGETVIVDENIAGDLIVAGQNVFIKSDIGGNAIIAARSVTVEGVIDGSLYTAAGDVILEDGARIERNLLTSAFSVSALPESLVGKNAYIAAYQALLKGDINQNVTVGVGALEVTGRIGGDLNGEVAVDPNSAIPTSAMPFTTAPVESGLRISSDAIIGGDLNVSETVVNIDSEATVDAWYYTTLIQNRLGELIALLILTGICMYFGLPLMGRLAGRLAAEPTKSAVWGGLSLLLMPLAVLLAIALLLLVTGLAGGISLGRLAPTVLGLGGSVLGLIVIAFAFTAQLLSKVVVALFAGRWLMDKTQIGNRDNPWVWFGFAALAILLFELVRLVPFLGGILTLVVMVFGVGTIAVYLWDRYRGGDELKPVPTVAPEPAVA